MNIQVIEPKTKLDAIDNVNESVSISYIDYKLISYNPYQYLFSTDEYEGIKDSINEIGLIEAPIVYESNGRYVVLSGNTRTRALIDLIESRKGFVFGNKEYKNRIPVRIIDGSDESKNLSYFLSSNLEQRHLNQQQKHDLAVDLTRLFIEKDKNGVRLDANIKNWVAKNSSLSKRKAQEIINEVKRGSKKEKKTNVENFVSFLEKVNKRIISNTKNNYPNSDRTDIIDRLDDIVDSIDKFKKDNQV